MGSHRRFNEIIIMKKIIIESALISVLAEVIGYLLFENMNFYKMIITFFVIFVIKSLLKK
jgi:hypothetical protein